MQIKGPEIFLPERAEVYLSSDGIDFTPANSVSAFRTKTVGLIDITNYQIECGIGFIF